MAEVTRVNIFFIRINELLEQNMNRYRAIAINRVFLLTVLFSVLGSFINGYIIEYTGNYLLVLLTSQII